MNLTSSLGHRKAMTRQPDSNSAQYIHVVEPVCPGLEHVPFNAATLRILLLAFPSDQLIFFGESDHIEGIHGELDESQRSRIRFVPIVISPRRAKDYRRMMSDYFVVNRVIAEAKRTRTRQVVFTSISIGILRIIKHLDRRLSRSAEIVTFLHSGAKDIQSRRGRSLRHLLFDLRGALVKAVSCPRFRCFVLERSIKQAIAAVQLKLADSIEVLEHPLPVTSPAVSSPPAGRPLRFGYLGLATIAKGFPKFCEIASDLHASNTKATFHCIGSSRHDDLRHLATILDTQPGRQKISREQYLRSASDLDYCVFPYQSQAYAFTASGALLDSIALKLPIIATDIPIFRDLFKRFGSLGYLIPEDADWTTQLQKIIRAHTPEHYISQVRALELLAESRTESILAAHYRKICSAILFSV